MCNVHSIENVDYGNARVTYLMDKSLVDNMRHRKKNVYTIRSHFIVLLNSYIENRKQSENKNKSNPTKHIFCT